MSLNLMSYASPPLSFPLLFILMVVSPVVTCATVILLPSSHPWYHPKYYSPYFQHFLHCCHSFSDSFFQLYHPSCHWDKYLEYLCRSHLSKHHHFPSHSNFTQDIFGGILHFFYHDRKVTVDHNDIYQKGYIKYTPERMFQIFVECNPRLKKMIGLSAYLI